MADFTKFRTSIGGFNRDDVVHYIETASVEHLKELRQVNMEFNACYVSGRQGPPERMGCGMGR